MDYLLKPIDLAELKNAVIKAEQRRVEKKTSSIINLDTLLKKINYQNKKIEVITSDRITYIKISEIIRFEGEGNYVRIITSMK